MGGLLCWSASAPPPNGYVHFEDPACVDVAIGALHGTLFRGRGGARPLTRLRGAGWGRPAGRAFLEMDAFQLHRGGGVGS